jgi:hypothetical protein
MNVVHNEQQHRFEVSLGGATAFLAYQQAGERVVINHTEVPPQFEGQGIGGALVRAAVDHAHAQQLRVVARCPFARAYIQRHPELASP